MTIVELTIEKTWLTSLNDSTISIQADTPTRTEADGVDGTVASYAGRSVAEVGSARARSTPITLYLLDGADDIEQLRAWWLEVEPLLMRDNLGWWRSGVIMAASLDDRRHTDDRGQRVLQVDATFMDIDWDFAV